MGSTDSRRPKRLATLLRGELQKLLIEEVSDPGLRSVSVTEVELTADLKTARVHYSLGEGLCAPEKQVVAGFRRAAPFLRKRVGENLELRYVPVLEFRRDRHGESVHRLMHLMEEVSTPL